MRSWMRAGATVALSALLVAAVPSHASETITYSYDALGRLVKVARAGTVNAGATECYAYDPASNRSNVTVATSSDCTAGAGVSFSISSNGPITEGTPSVFTITKSGTAAGTLTVNYATANGTAVAGSNYTANSGTLTFTSAQSSQAVNVTTLNTGFTGSKTFSMSLSSPSNGSALGTPSTATATINGSDGGSSCSGIGFAIGNASAVEGDPLVFTVTKSGSTTSSCGVNYATANGTATAGTHYTAASGTLTFTSAQTSQTISITTFNLNRTVGTKTMYVNLSSPTGGATITTSQGTGSISPSGDPNGCPLC